MLRMSCRRQRARVRPMHLLQLIVRWWKMTSLLMIARPRIAAGQRLMTGLE